ncbi:MAG: hypothetical protein LBU88_00290 [Treponema sp.]|jgi:hypothetical protein|nr:hypothetical protein [Treponema sp.]
MSVKKRVIPNFWKDKKLTDDEKNEMLVETVRKVFSTEDGKIVLNMLLRDLCVFEPIAGDGLNEKALNEYGKFFIRKRLGLSETKLITDFIADTAFSGRG